MLLALLILTMLPVSSSLMIYWALNDRKRRVLTCDVESQPAPLLSRQSKILKVVSDFKYLVSWASSTEKGIEVRKSLAWEALNDMSSIWSSNLSRDLKIRVFQATIESVLYFMAARDGHLLSQWKSPSIGTTPACLPMSLATVGETESPTPNFTATFQLCQTGSDSERLVLLAIATVTANCQQASLSCGGRHTDTYDAIVQSLHS